ISVVSVKSAYLAILYVVFSGSLFSDLVLLVSQLLVTATNANTLIITTNFFNIFLNFKVDFIRFD
ncbi:MAG: hypothetical protein DRI88_10345, partial [Bacteroidetes bacterium]